MAATPSQARAVPSVDAAHDLRCINAHRNQHGKQHACSVNVWRRPSTQRASPDQSPCPALQIGDDFLVVTLHKRRRFSSGASCFAHGPTLPPYRTLGLLDM
ncbi:hypothetical protein L1887_57002 [Cichorium endivia]|nr:hypothetical protein L1887_57002 [Cichorium endivia]